MRRAAPGPAWGGRAPTRTRRWTRAPSPAGASTTSRCVYSRAAAQPAAAAERVPTAIQEDSCGGTTHGSIWDQYARMRDALNKTGRPIYYSITGIVPYNDAWPSMHCIGDGRPGFAGAFTVRPWVAEGRDPGELANVRTAMVCLPPRCRLTQTALLPCNRPTSSSPPNIPLDPLTFPLHRLCFAVQVLQQ